MSVKFVYGDLLKTKDVNCIVHQVNCLCIKAHGLSQQIADKFPWADIYSSRQEHGNKNLAITNDSISGQMERCKSKTSKLF